MITTMISEPQTSKSRIGVGLDATRRPGYDQQAWKRNIGTKPIPARLAMLPEGESRMKRVGVSAILQTAFVGFIFIIPLVFPQQMKTALGFPPSEIAMPITLVPIAPPPPPPKIAKVNPPPAPVQPPPEVKLNPKQPHIFEAPKVVVQPKVQPVENKAPEIDRKSTRLNSSHRCISYAVFCLKKKT